jgi:aldehyde:ferredoxin oxidoreductase
MYGYMGNILYVDLSRNKIVRENLDKALAIHFLGGRGLGVKILYDFLGRGGVDPFSPDNLLIFATGPLTGTRAPTSGRHCVVTKSPLTGACLDTHAGGHFGVELKRSGYDLVVVKGRADKPVYLYIDDGEAELRSAEHLWGLTVGETITTLKETIGNKDLKVSCIGPAGENLVRIASIMNDLHRAAGRGGAGAVMGSKRLKAIAVRGSKEPSIARPEVFEEAIREAISSIARNDITKKDGTLPKYGTAGIVNVINTSGIFPTKNFQKGVFEHAEKISGEELARTYLRERRACAMCPIPCSRYSTLDEGPYKGVSVEGPEYETIWAFGAHCYVDRLDAIIMANYLCNMYGMDTISTGGVIGFAMECFERGLIGLEDTGGVELKFGNAEAMIQMIHKIAKKEGFGAILSEGVARASRIIGKGSENFAMHVKGLEIPAYDPRGAKAQGLSYAVSNRGACHLRAYMIKYEIFGTPFKVDRFDQSTGKVKLLINTEHEYAVIDSLVLCIRLPLAVDFGTIAKLLSSATGWDFSEKELYEVGERIWNLERLFNVREGFSREHDTLPPRILTEPFREGPAAGHVVNLKDMLEDYYKLRGWDENGKPTKERLKQLKLL